MRQSNERSIADPSLTVLCNIARAIKLTLSQLVGESCISD